MKRDLTLVCHKVIVTSSVISRGVWLEERNTSGCEGMCLNPNRFAADVVSVGPLVPVSKNR